MSSISPQQSDIASQILAALNVAEPDLDTSVGTTARKLVDSVSNQIAAAYADNNISASSSDVTNLTGAALDNYVAGFGMVRFPAKNASGLALFSRPPNVAATPPPDVTIPGGTIIATTDTNPVTFSVMYNAVLPSADLTIDVPVIAVAAGSSGNVAAGNISVVSTPISGISSVSNPLAMTGGADAESDAALIARFQATNFRGFTGTTANLVGVALENQAVSRVNAIGARSTTQVQVNVTGTPGTGTTQPIEWPYIYPDNIFFGADIAGGQILNSTSQYTATITLDGGTGLYYIAITVVAPTFANVVATTAATVPATITTSNNTFSFGGEVYTVTPGTYSTAPALMAALAASVASTGPLSSVITLTGTGTFTATSVTSGPAANGLAFAEGTGTLALSGFGAGQALAGGSGAPNGIYELQYDYLSPWTRNSVANHILNDVDIWTDGTDYQEATETLPFGVGSGAPAPAGTFNTTVGNTYNTANWIRSDGITHPTVGNFFIPLTFVPPAALPTSLFDGSHNGPIGYLLGTDYWLVYNTGATGWAPQSLAGIEWLAADTWGAAGNWVMAVEYYYNAVPTEIENSLAGQSLAGTQNVWAHQANEQYLNFTFVVVLTSGYTYSSVLPSIEAALVNVCEGITFTQTLEVSEIIAAIQDLTGIQAVRMATPAVSSTSLGDVATTVAAASNGVALSSFTAAAPGTLNVGPPIPPNWPTSGVVQLYSGTTTLTWMGNVFYSAVAGNSLTGCITMSGSGTLATGNVVQGPYHVQQVTAPIEATINTTGQGVTEVDMPTSNIVQTWPVRTDITFNEVSYPVFNNAWLVVRSQNTYRANEND